MIDVSNISFKYSGQKDLVFDNFSLRLEANNIYGLLGKNGTGKSTLLYLISGLLRPSKGRVRFDGVDTSARRPDVLSEIFIVPEEFDLPMMSLEQYVRINEPFYPRFSREVLESCLNDFELSTDIKLNALSMGQKKKVFMSFALATNTRYLLMDEPTNGLDIPSKSQFRKVVAQNMTDERTVVISTHQVHDVEALLHHILILSQRELLLNAPVSDLTARYVFEYRPVDSGSSLNEASQGQSAPVIYSEPTLQGNAVMAERREGDAETQLNLELLFNAETKQRI